ncbi:hypothetical protein E4K64_19160 [Bradyrhizobium frederickii]|uniref:Uncharacterized protein n=1 Tax=Bradyrhizobium frederickii TaxID=2560054 RepID=A0A4Y9P5Z4_9BRAD|nr:hypothetical protein [Bradyrhizobium frederickii]TFV74113.1 hypothetical protein E4K64_19160 [Bradyrhizobium frederickii]
MTKRCQQCGEDFTPYMGRQRFCCRECSDAWFAEERRTAVRRLRESAGDEAPQSYFAMEAARLDANATLIGSATPPPLAAPQWSRDLAALPKEPPLGDDVNALPDCSGIGGQNLEVEDGEAA